MPGSTRAQDTGKETGRSARAPRGRVRSTQGAAPNDLLSLQRTIGNQQVAKLVIQRGQEGAPGPTGKPPKEGYKGKGISMVDGQPLVQGGQWVISFVQQASSFAGHTWVILEGWAPEHEKEGEGAWQWMCDFVAPKLPAPDGGTRYATTSELILANSLLGPEMIGQIRVFEDRAARDKWVDMKVLAKRTFRVSQELGLKAQQKITADMKRRIPYRMTGKGYVYSTPSDAESCASWTVSVGEAAGITGLGGWVVDTPGDVGGA
jgi:hypothetical protein